MSVLPSSSNISTKKRINNENYNQQSQNKKCCIDITENTIDINTHWSNDYTEGDSIFSEITFDDLNCNSNNKDDLELEEHKYENENSDDDNVLQCTQKFLNDIKSKTSVIDKFQKNELLRLNYIFGSQYHTRDDIKNRTIANLNYSDFFQNSEWNNYSTENLEIKNDNDDFPSKGSFYDLPENVEKLLFKYKGITDLYGKY